MDEEKLTRQELHAIFSNPASTQEQRIQAKLILCKRISGTPGRIRQFLETLPPEIAEPMRVNHPRTFVVELAIQAEQEKRRLEALLAQLQSSDLAADQPAV